MELKKKKVPSPNQILSKFADNTEIGGIAGIPSGSPDFQPGLDRIESWVEVDLMKSKCEVLYLGRSNSL